MRPRVAAGQLHTGEDARLPCPPRLFDGDIRSRYLFLLRLPAIILLYGRFARSCNPRGRRAPPREPSRVRPATLLTCLRFRIGFFGFSTPLLGGWINLCLVNCLKDPLVPPLKCCATSSRPVTSVGKEWRKHRGAAPSVLASHGSGP